VGGGNGNMPLLLLALELVPATALLTQKSAMNNSDLYFKFFLYSFSTESTKYIQL
jgi:hypothetical protein